VYSRQLELFNNLKETFMNKLIASLIIGAFSAAAFATTPATSPAVVSGVSSAPTSAVAKAEHADKAHAKSVPTQVHAAAKKAEAVK